jgi:hypothetical protein
MQSSTQPVRISSSKLNTWVFMMAGQSNMAGRGIVESQDTVTSDRIFTINAAGQFTRAQEPLHFYEPTRTGLDCGMSFAFELLKHIPDSVNLLIVPTAIGGSSLRQWTGDSLYRGVHLLTNFREKAEWAKQYGAIKGILWHQGESDANDKDIPFFHQRLTCLFRMFRDITGDLQTPILLGELGAYSETQGAWNKINTMIKVFPASDPRTAVVTTADLKDNGDKVHFNSAGQRELGKRFAFSFLTFKKE